MKVNMSQSAKLLVTSQDRLPLEKPALGQVVRNPSILIHTGLPLRFGERVTSYLRRINIYFSSSAIGSSKSFLIPDLSLISERVVRVTRPAAHISPSDYPNNIRRRAILVESLCSVVDEVLYYKPGSSWFEA
jgi:hypothetical protein